MQITQYLPKIIEVISKNDVSMVTAPTGTGKSIGIPMALAASNKKVYIAVPTAIAAKSLCNYQRFIHAKLYKEMSDSEIDRYVGYSADGKNFYNEESMIVYATSGHIRKLLLAHFANGSVRPLAFCDVLIVDEVHHRSADNETILGVWKYVYDNYKAGGLKIPSLAMMSATPSSAISDIFGNIQVANYVVTLPSYEIKYYYGTEDYKPDDPKLYYEAAKTAVDVHKKHPVADGHVLIFAPGISDIQKIIDGITLGLKGSNLENYSVMMAHSMAEKNGVNDIYASTGDKRKIIVATNVAESSVTIPDIGFVIDTMAEKRAEKSHSGGLRLIYHRIARDSAVQRAGRTGRTKPGVCYRLCREELMSKLEETRKPEILRIPIENYIMELLKYGLKPSSILPILDPVEVDRSVSNLYAIGMVDRQNKITQMGGFAPTMQMSYRNSGILWLWLQDKTRSPFNGIVTAAAIDSFGPSYFFVPGRQPGEEEAATLERQKAAAAKFTPLIGESDLESALNIWNLLIDTAGGFGKITYDTIFNLSKEYSLNYKKVGELYKSIYTIYIKLSSTYRDIKTGKINAPGVISAIRPYILTCYQDRIMVYQTPGIYKDKNSGLEYRLNNNYPSNRFAENYPVGIVALSTVELPTRGKPLRICNFAIGTDVDHFGNDLSGETKSTQRKIVGAGVKTFDRSQLAYDPNLIVDAYEILNSLPEPTYREL